jgi:outer membrane lipopolysaccharide assembly protein LptE/RlpB
MQRRHLLARLATTAALGALAGCGFRLRGSYTFRFRSLYLIGAGPVAQELRLALESSGAGV